MSINSRKSERQSFRDLMKQYKEATARGFYLEALVTVKAAIDCRMGDILCVLYPEMCEDEKTTAEVRFSKKVDLINDAAMEIVAKTGGDEKELCALMKHIRFWDKVSDKLLRTFYYRGAKVAKDNEGFAATEGMRYANEVDAIARKLHE